jgi:hypothetical protein
MLVEDLKHFGQFPPDSPKHLSGGTGGFPFMGALAGIPATPQAFDGKTLLVTHPLDLEEGFHIFLGIHSLMSPALSRPKKIKLRLPISEHIGGKPDQTADFADLVEEFLLDRHPAASAFSFSGSDSHWGLRDGANSHTS